MILSQLPTKRRPEIEAGNFSNHFATKQRNIFALPICGCRWPISCRTYSPAYSRSAAFANIFQFILGVSQPAVQLRAAVWESIFTHDMRRYRQLLYSRMADFTTLVTGPSGTGKELVVRYWTVSVYPIRRKNRQIRRGILRLVSRDQSCGACATLIESELFGHKRGSFTGAVADRQGWLEVCPALGTVFLDEIGDLDRSIQVKLLRVLQSREFSRIGESAVRCFRGKIIAATNRNLAEEMHCGRFRGDFYYRLCSDVIDVPGLHVRIANHPEELVTLVRHIAERTTGVESRGLADESVDWIERNLGRSYAWPGNIRELEQCVRNILIRGRDAPAQNELAPKPDPRHDLWDDMAAGRLTADELLKRYCTMVFDNTGSYEATARKLKLDRRTVRAKVSSPPSRSSPG